MLLLLALSFRLEFHTINSSVRGRLKHDVWLSFLQCSGLPICSARFSFGSERSTKVLFKVQVLKHYKRNRL